MIKQKNTSKELHYSTQTFENINWIQNDTGIIPFENKYYCIDENHYITQPNWITCEICNCIIKDKE